ncbi:response regulator transcription factor [Paenarthrobacter sp. NPDC090520]|uniref:response regulator transcription factor n=1 Tax=Paenarthrobacter sp. NPDC090520 TaxID=3364382 RepID=UPI0037FAD0E6
MDGIVQPGRWSRTAVIIEDEADIRAALAEIFTAAGFSVHTFDSGVEGVEGVRAAQPDVVTLDLGLADIDGFEVARRVRLFSDAYIVMLTARTQELDTLLGLEAGADDYVTKPFRPRELRYRVEALLRRPRARAGSRIAASFVQPRLVADDGASTPPPEILEHNNVRMNVEGHSVSLDGNEVGLTRSEFDLLHALLKAAGNVLTKEELTDILHDQPGADAGYWSDSDGRALHVHVTNLRRKLGDSAATPRWIETVRGVGYRLAPRR